MATRFYFPSTVGGFEPSSYDSSDAVTGYGWTQDGIGSNVFRMVREKLGTAPGTKLVNKAVGDTRNVTIIKALSESLAAQDISGTVKGQFLAREATNGHDGCAQITIRVVSEDGSTIRGTLLAVNDSALSSEFVTTLTNRRFPRVGTVTVSDVTCQDGDRIEVVIGYRAFGTTTNGSTIQIGDNGTDLAENETATSGDPWLEFSQSLTFRTYARTSLLSEDFAGLSDGAAWPSEFNVQTRNGAVADVQTERGHISVVAQSAQADSAAAVKPATALNEADVDIYVNFSFSSVATTAELAFPIDIRSPGDWVSPFDRSSEPKQTFECFSPLPRGKLIGTPGTSNKVEYPNARPVADTNAQWWRMRRENKYGRDVMYQKFWTGTLGSEPAEWDQEFFPGSDGTTTGTVMLFAHSEPSTTGGNDLYVDDIDIGNTSSAVNLVIQNGTHVHSAENLALTQVHELGTANAAHGHTAANVVLTEDAGAVQAFRLRRSDGGSTLRGGYLLRGDEVSGTNLVVQDASHAHTAEQLTLTQVHELVIANASHAHTAENASLTQVHQLAVQEGAHSHLADNLAITQVHELAIQAAAHGHSADNVDLSTADALGIQDATHAHTAEQVSLTQVHQLAIADASHAHSADNVALVVDLAISNALHAHSAENLVLTQVHVLTVQDATHAHSAESVVLTQVHALTVQDATHVHTSESVALTQVHELGTQNAAHAHTAETPALTQVHSLVIANAVHAHTADNLAISTEGELGIASAAHNHQAENLILTQVHNLAVADGIHAHTADNVSVGVDLVIASASHAHSAESLALTQVHALVVQNASHGHVVDNIALGIDLTIQSATHAHAADSLGLVQVHGLAVQDATHSHSADGLVLEQLHLLVIASALHGHLSENVVFLVWAATNRRETVATPRRETTGTPRRELVGTERRG